MNFTWRKPLLPTAKSCITGEKQSPCTPRSSSWPDKCGGKPMPLRTASRPQPSPWVNYIRALLPVRRRKVTNAIRIVGSLLAVATGEANSYVTDDLGLSGDFTCPHPQPAGDHRPFAFHAGRRREMETLRPHPIECTALDDFSQWRCSGTRI